MEDFIQTRNSLVLRGATQPIISDRALQVSLFYNKSMQIEIEREWLRIKLLNIHFSYAIIVSKLLHDHHSK